MLEAKLLSRDPRPCVHLCILAEVACTRKARRQEREQGEEHRHKGVTGRLTLSLKFGSRSPDTDAPNRECSRRDSGGRVGAHSSGSAAGFVFIFLVILVLILLTPVLELLA